MGGKGGGTNTVTTQAAPNPAYTAAFQQAQQQATNVAGTPYQSYPGQAVAQLSPDQIAAMGQVEGLTANGGVQAPYLQAAQGYFGQATQPLLTPSLQQEITANSGEALQPATSAAVSGVQGATSAGQAGLQGATGQGMAGIGGATGAGVAGISGAGNSLTPASLAQWENPYTQQVVGATQQQFNQQNAQQQSQVAGNAISQGAYGGDRSAVAAALTAGQQQLAQAPVIAGLESSGYTTALGAAQQQAALQTQAATAAGSLGLQGASTAASLGETGASTEASLGLQGATTAGQAGMTGATTESQLGLQGAQASLGANEANAWLASQAGFGEANLGSEADSLGLGNASALLQTGGLEQQQAQENLNIPYEQYLAQQAYPFQTTGWLANISEGLGGASGGTSSTTSPGPSTLSQVAGLGAGGLGLYGAANQAGLFNSAGSAGSTSADALAAEQSAASAYTGASEASIEAGANSGLGAIYKRGGMIQRRASGGAGISPTMSDPLSSGSPLSSSGMSPASEAPAGMGNPMSLAGPAPTPAITTSTPDANVSVVPGAAGMGDAAPLGAKRDPAMTTSTGSNAVTTGGPQNLSSVDQLTNEGAQVAASVFGGPLAGIAAGLGSAYAPSFSPGAILNDLTGLRSGGGIPRRQDGGGATDPTQGTTITVQPGGETQTAPTDPSQAWYSPLVQENFASQMAAALTPPPAPSDGSTGMRAGGNVPHRQHFDAGGMSIGQESPWWARAEERQSTDRHGLLASPIAGRTDQLAVNPATGSYVVPADVVSGLGEGNTLAGANVMQRMLDTGPHGLRMPTEHHDKGPPRPPPAYREGEMDDGMASGGMVRHYASGGMSPAVSSYLAGNGAGGFGSSPTSVPYTGINASTGAGSSNTGIPELDAYLNGTESGARFTAPPFGPPPAALPAPAQPTPSQQTATQTAQQQAEQQQAMLDDAAALGAPGGGANRGGGIQRRADGGPSDEDGPDHNGWDDADDPASAPLFWPSRHKAAQEPPAPTPPPAAPTTQLALPPSRPASSSRTAPPPAPASSASNSHWMDEPLWKPAPEAIQHPLRGTVHDPAVIADMQARTNRPQASGLQAGYDTPEVADSGGREAPLPGIYIPPDETEPKPPGIYIPPDEDAAPASTSTAPSGGMRPATGPATGTPPVTRAMGPAVYGPEGPGNGPMARRSMTGRPPPPPASGMQPAGQPGATTNATGATGAPGTTDATGQPGSQTDSGRHRFTEQSADPWLALADAGFAIAAGRSPHALENIGAGAERGVQSYIQQKQQAQAHNLQAGETEARLADTAAYRDAMRPIQQQRADAYSGLSAAHTEEYNAQAAKLTAASANGNGETFKYIGNDPNGMPLLQGNKGTMRLGSMAVGLTTNQQATDTRGNQHLAQGYVRLAQQQKTADALQTYRTWQQQHQGASAGEKQRMDDWAIQNGVTRDQITQRGQDITARGQMPIGNQPVPAQVPTPQAPPRAAPAQPQATTAAPAFKYQAAGENGAMAYSNDGQNWVTADGKPITGE